MSESLLQTTILHFSLVLTRFHPKILSLFAACLVLLAAQIGVSAQDPGKPAPATSSLFKANERITYNISFGRNPNAAYAEIYVVSRGKIGERDAFELRSKFKTLDLTSAIYLLDEARTTFAASDTGLPLYIVKTSTETGSPKETIENYLQTPTQNFDLLSVIYQARNSGGSGTFSLQEGEKLYNVIFAPGAAEKVKTDAGEFDTIVSAVQSEFFTQNGILEAKINFSTDEQRIPVLVRLKTAKGEFRAAVASIQMIEPEKEPETAGVPTPTPRMAPTPKPPPTPAPYVDNQPLLPELSFVLGETLDYLISSAGQPVGNITLQARERKQGVTGPDSLFLTADVTAATGQGMGLFKTGDAVRSEVSPDTLTPFRMDIKFSGAWSSLNQTAIFDQRSGAVMFGGATRIEAPVGTHSLLSFLYAVRSFNLKPSKDPKNPVNDTRVAVFWGGKPYVFTLRPSDSTLITLRGEKVSAQMVSIITGDPALDILAPKIWLGNDTDRLPLRFSIGNYQADLMAKRIVQPK